MERTLKSLAVGESGKVIKLKGQGETRRRLMDMGIVAGTTISVERVAPLGDPIEVKVRGYNLSLRKDEANNILIE